MDWLGDLLWLDPPVRPKLGGLEVAELPGLLVTSIWVISSGHGWKKLAHMTLDTDMSSNMFFVEAKTNK